MAAREEMLVAVATGEASAMQSGSEALRAFRPLVEPQYEQGECVMVRDEPAPGVRTLVVHFPSRKEPHTGVTVTLGADGKLVRYIENHGMPQPSKDMAAMQEALRSMPQTIITLDYVTGQAIASNRDGKEGRTGVRGSVEEFERAGVVRDIPDHVSEVQALCAGRAREVSR